MITRAELEKEGHVLGTLLAEAMPEGVGFGLLLFDFGEGGSSAYVSNGRREDMIRFLRETLEHLETL